MSTEERAKESLGASSEAIYEIVSITIKDRGFTGGSLLDVGCGSGKLWQHIHHFTKTYIGLDVIRFDEFPDGVEFRQVNLDTGIIEMPDGTVDVVTCVETIEHVENPRALIRELTRLVRPGGLVIITTPNQISLLSKLGLLVKNQFPAFQERPGLYPAHITALLPIDLQRMAGELGLVELTLRYSDSGRIPGTKWPWPWPFHGQHFSDNVLLAARRPS